MPKKRGPQLTLDYRTALRGEVLRTMKTGRDGREWTQDDVAALLGVSQQAVSKVLKGAAGPPIADLICEKLDTTKEQLLRRLQRGDYTALIAEADKKGHRPVRTPTTSAPPSLTEARRAALEAEDWAGVTPEEYAAVEEAIASEAFSTGREPVVSYWVARVKTHRAEFRGRVERDVVSADPSSPDPAIAAERERRKARRQGTGGR